MMNILDIPISSVTALSPESSIDVIRAILRAECGYAKLSPSVLTISSRLTTADGGIDAEVNTPDEIAIPVDCIFQAGVTGFQIKSGTSFKPWTLSSIRGELLDSKGRLHSEVNRLVQRRGYYTILCTGHDLTPEQRNDAQQLIAEIFAEKGFNSYDELIEVFGASQIAEFAERYPGTTSLLSVDPIQEAWVLDEWQRDAHMTNTLEASPEQSQIIEQIRENLQGETKHIRILGEPGLGKTRIVLESVKEVNLAPYVLYIQHGNQFGRTKLFRQLIKSEYDKPLVLIIDEFPESELSDIWRHLKPRCGSLKLITIDHGRDETTDEEIERLHAPSLSDETIKQILINRVGKSHGLERWVSICEGSPRVAQAVADNLLANPEDILKPPATVPIWSRFLHGYDSRDDIGARQVDCVAQHLALFSRFGYEAPVGEEAKYISELIKSVDPTTGWARFQEIVQSLRARRVLQGSRTLFFVPKALHIYLWKQFWENYGRGFDFTQTFKAMPATLHTWFMNMFKYADEGASSHVIDDILKTDGIFSQREVLTSSKGASFLSILAEANPGAVLRLLETTIGKWSDEELLNLTDSRQNFVWTLEKIAVWIPFTVRAIQILARLALNENASNSNNSMGTLLGLFHIGSEAAATESSPEERLPAILKLLRSSKEEEKRLGLKAMGAALNSRGMGFRVIGPEYQGIKERAKLWIPATYSDWWQAFFIYFQTLVDETQNWPSSLRYEVCNALIDAVEQQIKTPPCTELAFQVLGNLINDKAMSPEKLNGFFWHWREYEDYEKHPEIAKRLRDIEHHYTRRDLSSRFQRYVIDVDWLEWDEDFRERHNKSRNHSKTLVNALARRITQHPETFSQIQHLLTPEKNAVALWHFSTQLSVNDPNFTLLPAIIKITLERNHHSCLLGYLSTVRDRDTELYTSTIKTFLDKKDTAWLGAKITLSSDYDDDLFVECLNALDKGWLDPLLFGVLRFGKTIETMPSKRIAYLLTYLNNYDTQDSLFLLVELLDSLTFTDSSPFDPDFVFDVVSRSIPDDDRQDGMRGYHWKNVCLKLIEWDSSRILSLLNVLLTGMGKVYRLSYDSDVKPLANELVQADPAGAWNIVRNHFEETLPKWRSDLFSWLKGSLSTFNESVPRGAIVDLPIQNILKWIEKDPEQRASLMAHTAPATLDNEHGGQLTRELLHRYSQIDGVISGISSAFHSGGWSGPTSAYLKRKREKLRRWLAAGFEIEITQWIETEIEYLDASIEDEEIKEERSRFD